MDPPTETDTESSNRSMKSSFDLGYVDSENEGLDESFEREIEGSFSRGENSAQNVSIPHQSYRSISPVPMDADDKNDESLGHSSYFSNSNSLSQSNSDKNQTKSQKTIEESDPSHTPEGVRDVSSPLRPIPSESLSGSVTKTPVPVSAFDLTCSFNDMDNSDDDDLLSQMDIDIENVNTNIIQNERITNVEPAKPITPSVNLSSSNVGIPRKRSFEEHSEGERISCKVNFMQQEKIILKPMISGLEGSMYRQMSPGQKQKPIQRMFPGPAGILPSLKPSEFNSLDSPSTPVFRNVSKIISGGNVSSTQLNNQSSQERLQTEKALLEGCAWNALLCQLDFDFGDRNIPNSCNPLSAMNIDWIRNKASKLDFCKKVPFLAAVLQESPDIITGLKGKSKAPCVKLIDPTGSIDAALEADFATRFSSDLQAGTAFALQNVGILRHKRQTILTITKKNVIFLVSNNESDCIQNSGSGSKSSKLGTSKSEFQTIQMDGIRIIKFSTYAPEKLLENYNSLIHCPIEEEDEDEGHFPNDDDELDTGQIQQENNNTVSQDQAPFLSNPSFSNRSNSEAEDRSMPSGCSFNDDEDEEFIKIIDSVDF